MQCKAVTPLDLVRRCHFCVDKSMRLTNLPDIRSNAGDRSIQRYTVLISPHGAQSMLKKAFEVSSSAGLPPSLVTPSRAPESTDSTKSSRIFMARSSSQIHPRQLSI